MITICRPLLLLAAVIGMSACQPASTPTGAPSTDNGDTALARTIRSATDKVREELATKNIQVTRTGQPKAEITPAGDLLIDGKPVSIDADQRALLLDYRRQLMAIANAGIDIGAEGANLGLRAAGHAIAGVLKGDSDAVEAAIEADAAGIEAAADALCEQVKAMEATRQQLATRLPAFAPYATGDEEDSKDECRASLQAEAP